MTQLIYVLMLIASLVMAFALTGWTDGYYFVSTAGLLLLAAPLVYLGRRKSPKETRKEQRWERKHDRRSRGGLNITASIFRALLHAGLVWSYLLVGMWVLDAFPLRDAYYDGQLNILEPQLDALEEAGSWLEAAKRIKARLQGKLSRHKRAEYQVRHVRDLVKAGQAEQDATLRSEIWQNAIHCAAQYGVDDTAATALLAEHDARQALAINSREQDANSRQAVDSLKRTAEEARKQKRFEAADALLTASLGHPDVDAELRQLQYQNLLDWAAAETSLTTRKSLLTKALAIAKQHGLATERGTELLHKAEAALAASKPRDLPSGCRAKIVKLASELSPPLIVAELEIVDGEGEPIHGLLAKDFAVENSRGVKRCYVAEFMQEAVQGSMVLVIDRSGSTNGAPAKAAEAGALRLVEQWTPGMRLSAILFDDKFVHVDNIDGDDDLQRAFERFPPRGGTALYTALHEGAKRFQDNDAWKRIVCFTDGKNMTQGSVTLEQVIEEAKRLHVTIDMVALQTGDLDMKTLETITQGTGGKLFTAANPNDLAQQFVAVGQSLTQHVYRVAIPTTSSDDRPQLRIGAKHPLQVSFAEELSKTTLTANEPTAAR